MGSDQLVDVLTNDPANPFVASAGFSGDSDLVFTSSSNYYELSDKATRITLSSISSQGILHEKSFVFSPSAYTIKTESTIKNKGTHPWTANFYILAPR